MRPLFWKDREPTSFPAHVRFQWSHFGWLTKWWRGRVFHRISPDSGLYSRASFRTLNGGISQFLFLDVLMAVAFYGKRISKTTEILFRDTKFFINCFLYLRWQWDVCFSSVLYVFIEDVYCQLNYFCFWVTRFFILRICCINACVCMRELHLVKIHFILRIIWRF